MTIILYYFFMKVKVLSVKGYYFLKGDNETSHKRMLSILEENFD